jgi:hypothetical protein
MYCAIGRARESEAVMSDYLDNQAILSIINDPRYDAMRLRLTTDFVKNADLQLDVAGLPRAPGDEEHAKLVGGATRG